MVVQLPSLSEPMKSKSLSVVDPSTKNGPTSRTKKLTHTAVLLQGATEKAAASSTAVSSKKFMGGALKPESKQRGADTGSLPSVRNVCPPMLFDAHPFFQGCSDEFKKEMTEIIRLRYFDRDSSNDYASGLKELRRKPGMLSELFEEEPVGISRADQVVFQQGKAPPANVDGALLMFKDEYATVELSFNGNRVSCLRQSASIGLDVALGLATVSVFDVKIITETKQPMYFIGRQAFAKILEKPELEQDAILIRERFASEVSELLVEHFVRSIAKVKVRLFANMGVNFKTLFLKCVQVRLYAQGSRLCQRGDTDPCMICIFNGQASARVEDEEVVELSSSSAAPAWAAWWGVVETGSNSLQWKASVHATSDCIVWELPANAWKPLSLQFPDECRLLEKVAVKHAQLLYPFKKDVWHKAYLFQDGDKAFLKRLANVATQRVCVPGDIVVRASALRGDEMYLLECGSCFVYRESTSARMHAFDPASAERCGRMLRGACYGELAFLGVGDHTETVVCETVCDIRVLHRKAFMDACGAFPDMAEQMGTVTFSHRQRRDGATSAFSRLQLCRGLSMGAMIFITNAMYERAFFRGQTISMQGEGVDAIYVVLQGDVIIEVDGEEIGRVSAPIVLWEWALLQLALPSPATIRCATVCDCLGIRWGVGNAEALQEHYPADAQLFRKAAENVEAGVGARWNDGSTMEAQILQQALASLLNCSARMQTPIQSSDAALADITPAAPAPEPQSVETGQQLPTQHTSLSESKSRLSMHNSPQHFPRRPSFDTRNRSPTTGGAISERRTSLEIARASQIPHHSSYGMRVRRLASEPPQHSRSSKSMPPAIQRRDPTASRPTIYNAGRKNAPSLVKERRHSPRKGATSFLSGCSSAFVDVLSQSFEKKYFLEGQLLLRQNDPGVSSLFILDGGADVEVNGEKVDEVCPGDFLGEVVLLGMSDAYTASIRATGLVRAFFVDRAKMLEVIEDFPVERHRLQELITRRATTNKRLKQFKGGMKIVAYASRWRRAREQVKAAKAKLVKKDEFGRRRAGGYSMLGLPPDMAAFAEQVALEMKDRPDSDSDSDDGSEDGKVKQPSLRAVGKEVCHSWARKRKQALLEAAGRREVRALGDTAGELLPPQRSYQPSQVGLGTPWAEAVVSSGVAVQRLHKTRHIYGRPVWGEVFGGPATHDDVTSASAHY